MKTVDFQEANTTNMKAGTPIRELCSSSIYKSVQYNYTVTCHRLNLWERLRVLFLGNIWAVRMTDLTVLTTEKKGAVK